MSKKYCAKKLNNKTAYIKYVASIFKFLKKYPVKITKPTLFIDGECKKNPTLFEEKSMEGEVAVVAKSNRVGHCLLFFLKMLLDKKYHMASDILYNICEDKDNRTTAKKMLNKICENKPSSAKAMLDRIRSTSFTLDDITKYMAGLVQEFADSHDAKQKIIRIELSNGKFIKKKVDDIEIYDLRRLEEEVLEMLDKNLE